MDQKIRILGVILAGGKSQRFGKDKAEILIDGVPMLERIFSDLRVQVDDVVISGRTWRNVEQVNDRPAAGMGPLGGLCGALHCALERNSDAVLTVPVDVLPVPSNLVALLCGEEAAVFEDQHLIGYWPVSLAEKLDRYMESSGGGAFFRWLAETRARKVREPVTLYNVNTPGDLERYLAARNV